MGNFIKPTYFKKCTSKILITRIRISKVPYHRKKTKKKSWENVSPFVIKSADEIFRKFKIRYPYLKTMLQMDNKYITCEKKKLGQVLQKGFQSIVCRTRYDIPRSTFLHSGSNYQK